MRLRTQFLSELGDNLLWLERFTTILFIIDYVTLFSARGISFFGALAYLPKNEMTIPYLITLCCSFLLLLSAHGDNKNTLLACPRCKNSNLVNAQANPYCPLCKRGNLKALIRASEPANTGKIVVQQKIAYKISAYRRTHK
jgi:uncharacterized protein YbaR (Trm112 family)